MTQVSIGSNLMPHPTYASIGVHNEQLSIAKAQNETITTATNDLPQSDTETAIIASLKQEAQEHNLKFIGASVPQEYYPTLLSQLWLQEDIVPFAQIAGQNETLEEQVRTIRSHFDEQDCVRIELGPDREVLVSELVTLADYQQDATADDFALVQTLAKEFEGKRLAIINATPQGGGVALMRHALIRLFKLLGVDAHWYVLIPDQDVFNITKAKFHNVLQAVAHPDTILTHEDMELYDSWSARNAAFFEPVFKQSDVILIDDPQPAGLIPFIKQANPDAKIIFRSHIQVVAHLADQPHTPQYTTWNFIWDKAQHADLYIGHPMKMFIPACVPAEKIFYVPATTDPLDGLNKPLSEEQMYAYLQLFDTILAEAGQTALDKERPYIVQIARFDPSKGIPDLLESYRKLRDLLEQKNLAVPQLVIAGNSSIDDPDGVPIFNLIRTMLESESYASFAHDIKVARLPHRDQLLNTLLRKSAVVLQLSIKEGFEIKVTEALMKGKPVIAYRVGGIPLQIQEDVNGFLVEVGSTEQVAEHLFTLLTNEEVYTAMSKAASDFANLDYLTIPNAICWLYLSLQLLKGVEMDGQYQWVKLLAAQTYEMPQRAIA
jgi:glycosyltransferase involved in cell wall biosynthesis